MEKTLHTVNVEQKIQIGITIAGVLEQDKSILFAYLFGSFTDELLPFHDIDLGIYFVGNNRLWMSREALELAIILEKKLVFPVDVRVVNNAPVAFLYNVMQGKLIYEKDENIRCQVMENTVRQYLDMKPILYSATKEAFSHESQS